MNENTIQQTALATSPKASHHLFGPSRWPALVVCPRWQGREAGSDAERGTALHERFALAVGGGAVPSPSDYLDTNADALATRLREVF